MRPSLTPQIRPEDFRDFYWRKAELLVLCREVGLPTSGGKQELAERIERFLTTGEIPPAVNRPRSAAAAAPPGPLAREATIRPGYRSDEEHRRFFLAEIGAGFRFTVRFQRFCRDHAGQATYGDAIAEWHRLAAEGAPSEIAPQFEFNRFVRAFHADRPEATRAEALAAWGTTKARRGPNAYRRGDHGR